MLRLNSHTVGLLLQSPGETLGAREGLHLGRRSTSLLGTHLFLRECSGEVPGWSIREKVEMEFSWPMPTLGQRENNQAYLRFQLRVF